MPVGGKQTLRFGPFELDKQCGQLRKNGVGLKLQGQPIQILEILLEKAGQLVTREEIRQRLWASDTFVDFDHSLNTAVKKLRQALGDEADTPCYIETLPKRGYRFIGEVAREEPGEETREPPPVAVVPVEPAEPPRPLNRKHPLPWRRLAAVAAAALLAVVAYQLIQPPPQPRIVGSHALTKTGYRKALWPRLVTDGKSIYFHEKRPSGWATMQVGVGGGEVSEVSISATDVGSLDISKDGFELLLSIFDPKADRYDAWIQPLPTGPARLIVKDARSPVWTADGLGLLFTRNGDRDLYRANADGTEARRLAGFTEIADLAMSPDGRHLRFDVQPARALWEANVDGSNPHPILTKPGGVFPGSWSPDGKFYFFRSWYGDRFDLWVVPETRRWWSKRTPSPLQLTFGPISLGDPVVSKDGKHIYAKGVEHHGELSVFDSKSGQFVPYLSGIPGCYVDFSRDGKWVAYVSFPDGNLWRSRIDGSERMQLTVPPIAVLNPRWSPDGTLIAIADLSGGDRRHLGETQQIYVVSAGGGGPMLLLAGNPIVSDPTWSADGKAIAYALGGSGFPLSPIDIRILDLSTQKSTKVPGSEMFWSPRWSPDGKYLVALAGLPASKLMLFSFVTQTWEELISGGHYDWPSWSSDSKYVFAKDKGQLIRITASTRKKDMVADVGSFRSTAYHFWEEGWFGITPDGRPITTRDTATEEIYAFDLEYK